MGSLDVFFSVLENLKNRRNPPKLKIIQKKLKIFEIVVDGDGNFLI
jgi:hypothetical protein